MFIVPKPPAWMAQAVCASVGSEPFFDDDNRTIKPARSICGRCPVAQPCLDFALARPELEGVWAGTTPRGRRSLREKAA